MFPPQFCELPAPSLDLFDLDEHFSSERVRIAQLTNKCKCNSHTGGCTILALCTVLYPCDCFIRVYYHKQIVIDCTIHKSQV